MSQTPQRSPLSVWSAERRDAAPVLEALSKRPGVRTLDALPETAGLPGEGDFLALVAAPERQVAAALSGGTAPDAALRGWKDEAAALLRLHRHARARVRVVDVAAALAHPAAFRARFGLPGDAGPVARLSNEREDPVLLMFAQNLLFADAEARRLKSELDAVTMPLSEGAPQEVAQPAEALRDYLELRRMAEEADGERRMTQGAVDLLQDQNRLMQEELERLAGAQIDFERHAGELAALRARSGEKDASLRAAARMIADLEAQRDEMARLGDRLQRILRSRSYRITGPLRRLRALFMRRNAS